MSILHMDVNLHMSFKHSVHSFVWVFVYFYRIEHLSLNMAMQLLVGVPLEMVHGALRIGLVYVCGVLAGGRLISYIHTHTITNSVFMH